MKLSRKCEYACLAMIELSGRNPDEFTKIESISNTWNIPRKFLEQILITLKMLAICTAARELMADINWPKNLRKYHWLKSSD